MFGSLLGPIADVTLHAWFSESSITTSILTELGNPREGNTVGNEQLGEYI
jgi:hypothetical protein